VSMATEVLVVHRIAAYLGLITGSRRRTGAHSAS
jgi:hypothetical protein